MAGECAGSFWREAPIHLLSRAFIGYKDKICLLLSKKGLSGGRLPFISRQGHSLDTRDLLPSKVGPRLAKDRERFPPNNIPLMLAGAGLLWMGWTGFNGGDPYVASTDASLAVLNTHACAATSLLTWVALDLIFFRKASVIGAVQGMITGLVCITPAAGVVQGWAALIMGLLSGSVPWFTMMVIHKRSEFLQRVDDTMAVFHTHAVAGCLGGFLTGLFAKPRLNKLFFGKYAHYVGLFYGFDEGRTHAGFRQVGVQLIGIAFVIGVNVVTTSIICLLVRLIVPLRMSEEDLEIGDDAVHGEEAYAIWGDGERLENSGNSDEPRKK